jgi:hypothetical protein
MRWIQNEKEYRQLRILARTCGQMDSFRLPIDKARLCFCDVTALNERFPPLLQDLLGRALAPSCVYMVLDPDPEYFWRDRFGGYPVFEVSRGDSAEEYFRFLSRPFGKNRADNMADMWFSYAIFPSTLQWFVHTIRSDRDDTGHLWVPPAWESELRDAHPFLGGGSPGAGGPATEAAGRANGAA